ncbi:ATP-binding protein [Methylobacterium sp. C25]|uniref:ATP-binding protein n=1 Tax=Methylobacterium sp. C25 TaxID=2721622 RepID=UPI002D80A567|nr:winged helix-turn-helix domain-containing protein [Methylobacterium sp. C25]
MRARAPLSVELGLSNGLGHRFGCHYIYPEMRILVRGGQRVELRARAFDLLCVLVEARGSLVGKDELIEKVWSGAVVEENNLQAQISALRKALGPDRDLLSTEFGRGYRLLPGTDAIEGQAQLPAEPPQRAATCTLTNPITSLIGRSTEMSEIEGLLGRARLVTIVGPGGVGKTRLANEAGRRLVPAFPDGVFLAELGKLSEDQLVWPTIGAALSIPASVLRQPGRLRSYVEHRRILLVVDNCEHVVEAVAEVLANLLHVSANLSVLGTAQEPLGMPGEHVFRLGPLAVPPKTVREASEALGHPAVELFVERAKERAREFQLLDANACDVGEICRRLDGIPLALELAAARVAALGVTGVLTGLDDRFKLLTAGRRTVLARHRTLRSAVDWSHDLLSPEAKRLFRRVAAFPAAFTAEAAHQVAAGDLDEQWQTADLIGELEEKSLLLVDAVRPEPHFHMLETIRFYGLEKLAESNEVEGIARRHASFTAAMSEEASVDWRILPTEDWLNRHATGLDDIRAALDWALSASGDVDLGVTILSQSAPFWIQHSQHDEGQRRISEILGGIAIQGPIHSQAEMAAQKALGACLTWAKGPVAETRNAWSRALELAAELSDVEVGLQAHYGLWLFHLRCGDYAGSLRHAREMMEQASLGHDREAFAAGQRIAGVSHHFLGEHAEGRRLIETSLGWYDRHPPVQRFRFGLDQRVAGLAFLSRIFWIEGQFSTAIDVARDALEKARALDHACTLCCALAEGWCMVHALNGDETAVERAAPLLVQTASRHGLGFWKVYGELFMAWATTGNDEHPQGRIERVFAAASGMDFDPLYSTLITDLLINADVDHPAREAFLRLAERVDDGRDEAHWAWPEFLRVRAQITDPTPASRERELRRALDIAERQEAPALGLRVVFDLVKLLTDHGRRDEARVLLEPYLDLFPSGVSSRDWRAARSWYVSRLSDAD